MCIPSAPSAPPPPPPMPALPPPTPSPVLQPAGDNTGSPSSQGALAANRGRSSLRIDRTDTMGGNSGAGLNIPT